MQKMFSLIFLIIPFLFVSEVNAVNFAIINPYSVRTHSYKGQLHSHSTRSDGSSTPSEVVTNYKNAGYDFVSITDHMQNYNDPKDLTRNLIITQNPGITGILFIPGAEQNSTNNGKRPHIGNINALTPESNTLDAQVLINKIQAENGIAILNHPHWPGGVTGDTWSATAISSVHGYTAIEIFNPLIGQNLRNAEDIWDTTLTSGTKTWGIAADDCHVQASIYCKTAYVRVFANSLSVDEILTNIKTGNFYSGYTPHGSKDVELNITILGNTISASTNTASIIEFIGSGGTVKKIETNKTSASYIPTGTEKYIRIRVTNGESKVWSNPLFITQIIPSPTATPTKIPTLTPTKTPTLKPTLKPTTIVINPNKCTQCSALPQAKSKGDADCSNTTNINDASIWRSEFVDGELGTVTKNNWQADFDCDSKVTLNDISIWRDNFVKSL